MTDSEAAIVEAEALAVGKTQPNLRRYFASAGVIAASEFFSRLKGLVLIPLLTRHLGTINYGVWSQVLILATFVPLLMIMGTDSAIVRYLPGHDDAYQRRHFSGWLLTMLGLGALLCGLLVAAKGPISNIFFGGGQEYERFVPLAAATIYVNLLITGIRGWFRLKASSGGWAAVTAGQAVTSLIATILLLSLNKTIYQFVIYSVVLDSMLSVVLLFWVWRRYGFARPDFGLMPKLVRFGLPLVPAGFAVWGLNWLDRIFLVKYTDLSAIGRYSLAYSLGYLAIQVIANPIWTMYPTAAAEHWNQGDRAGVQHYFDRTAGAMLLLVAPVIAFTAVAGGRYCRYSRHHVRIGRAGDLDRDGGLPVDVAIGLLRDRDGPRAQAMALHRGYGDRAGQQRRAQLHPDPALRDHRRRGGHRRRVRDPADLLDGRDRPSWRAAHTEPMGRYG